MSQTVGSSAEQALHPEDSAEALQLAGRLHEAAAAYQIRLASTPNDPRTLSNYGGLLNASSRFDDAYIVLTRSIALDPTQPDAWSNLGNTLLHLARYDDAIAAYRNCLQRNPAHALALSNLGLLLDHRGAHELAQKFHQVAIQLSPDNVHTRTNYAISLLAQGDYVAGFREYEWRWTTHSSRSYGMTVPQWKGEDFPGRTLMIHTEGGFGDMIQFSRFIPLAAQRGGHVIVRARKELLTLLRQSFPKQQFFSEDDVVPPHDLQCPVLSLPFALSTTLTTIPGAGGFLHADAQKTSFWHQMFHQDDAANGARPDPLRVGLVWAGAPHPEIQAAELADRRRSTDLATFAPLARTDANILFYSLQIGEKSWQARTPPTGMHLVDHTPLLHDFSDTAALVNALDLVIAVDTSTAHVAAGLGKPVWMLSRYDQCWRWLSGRTDSPWYDSLRIYQQAVPLDWSDPIRHIVADLQLLAAPHTPPASLN